MVRLVEDMIRPRLGLDAWLEMPFDLLLSVGSRRSSRTSRSNSRTSSAILVRMGGALSNIVELGSKSPVSVLNLPLVSSHMRAGICLRGKTMTRTRNEAEQLRT